MIPQSSASLRAVDHANLPDVTNVKGRIYEVVPLAVESPRRSAAIRGDPRRSGGILLGRCDSSDGLVERGP
jgi:hypothetical protein